MSIKDLISAEKFRTKTGHIGTDESGFQFYRFGVFCAFSFAIVAYLLEKLFCELLIL